MSETMTRILELWQQNLDGDYPRFLRELHEHGLYGYYKAHRDEIDERRDTDE